MLSFFGVVAVCLFVFLWQARLSEEAILSAADGLVSLFGLLFRWGSCTGCFWWWYSSGFLCMSSHYLVLLRVSSLVVKGLGINDSTPKARSLISDQERRFHKWFFMVLNEIKTNTPKEETKDESKTNGSYKIRQMIIKVMEYTHIHIHPWAKSKSSTKIKYSRLTWWTKEIKNSIYQLRKKLTKAQTGKQN